MSDAHSKYPALMAYIESRNILGTAASWCAQLHIDEAEAREGAWADVAMELARAKADYAAEQKAQGNDGYPYNQAMGEFLGLAIGAAHEPSHGYYMAGNVQAHYELGVATREAQRLITAGKPLRIVAARSKDTRKPIRFLTFVGSDQIRIEGNTVTASNGKRQARLSSNWSVETCLRNVVRAMQSGSAYGETTIA